VGPGWRNCSTHLLLSQWKYDILVLASQMTSIVRIARRIALLKK
jgi:hypothetical protein